MKLTMTVSQALIAWLETFEKGPNGSFAAREYDAHDGKRTLGWGHVIKPGENIAQPISRETADALLKADLAWAEAAVNKLVTVALTQAEFDALVSFTFNCGVGNFQSSTLLRRLNTGDYTIGNEFAKWNKSGGVVMGGLVERRAKEAQMFSTGVYVNKS